ncbi:MAG: FtsX-like permease family protein [Bacteroidia bacterium]|nr:FtsX-like permease family protein [Bacteroidia bacterium]
MNIQRLSWKNIIERPMSTFMSLLLLTLGVSIISLLLILNTQLDQTFKKNITGIDMVVGAKGSPLQLILASVYHIDNPTGNIPLKEAKELAAHPLIEKAIMMAYGDNYAGYRILGTDLSYIDHYEGELMMGKMYTKKFEVVLGAKTAQNLSLKVGDEFFGNHGSSENGEQHTENSYRVVGILKVSETVLDNLIFTQIESVWGIHEHEEEDSRDEKAKDEQAHEHEKGEEHEQDGDHEHEESKEITSMLLKWRSPMAMISLPRMINEETSMQAALPAIEVNRLFQLFAVGISTIRLIAIAIMVISAISVFVSLYNSLKDRKYEMALMRSMGASRGQLLWMVLFEGIILSVLGYVLGIGLSRLGIIMLSQVFVEDYHYELSASTFLLEEGWLFVISLGIGILAALIPGIQAFNINISETLADG